MRCACRASGTACPGTYRVAANKVNEMGLALPNKCQKRSREISCAPAREAGCTPGVVHLALWHASRFARRKPLKDIDLQSRTCVPEGSGEFGTPCVNRGGRVLAVDPV